MTVAAALLLGAVIGLSLVAGTARNEKGLETMSNTSSTTPEQDRPGPPHRHGVVVHLSELDRATAVLRNVINLSTAVGADAPLELVIHGDAIAVACATDPHAPTVADLLAAGVTVDVCRNSMTAQQINPTDLTPGVRIVPSGVAQLARRQWDGLAYLRP